MAAGAILEVDARETARALALMTDRYLIAVLGRNPVVEPAVVIDDPSS